MPSPISLTLPRVKGPVFALNAPTLEHGIAAAKESPRRRIILQIHRSDTEGVQRMLNFMCRGSYARPHCHPAPENIESVAILKGSVGVLIFEPDGAVQSRYRLDAGVASASLIDIEHGVWHTILPLTEDAVILEIKRGPYCAATDKTFATWAPAEGSEGSEDYLRMLADNFEGSSEGISRQPVAPSGVEPEFKV